MNDAYHKLLLEALSNLTERVKALEDEVKDLRCKDGDQGRRVSPYDASAHLKPNKLN